MLNLSWITDELAVGGGFSCDAVETLAREHRIASPTFEQLAARAYRRYEVR